MNTILSSVLDFFHKSSMNNSGIQMRMGTEFCTSSLYHLARTPSKDSPPRTPHTKYGKSSTRISDRELKTFATTCTSAEQHLDFNERLRSLHTLSETIDQSITDHQCVAMTSMKTEFKGMLTGFFTSFASQQQDSFPATPTPLYVVAPTPVAMPQVFATSAQSHPQPHATLTAPTRANVEGGSVSIKSGHSSGGSTRSYSSDVELPREKKSRGSIQADMSHLSLQPSDTESVYSDLIAVCMPISIYSRYLATSSLCIHFHP
jgi:hypothetical protein